MKTNSKRQSRRVHVSISAQSEGPLEKQISTPTREERNHWAERLEQSVREVFALALNANVESRHKPAAEDMELCSMVGLAGSLCGVLSLRCSSGCGAQMASNMLGADISQCNDNVLDACGEVCNMIAGDFKARSPGMAEGCKLSVPTVIHGKDYAVLSLADGERLQVLLEFMSHPVTVTLDLHS